MIKAVVGLNWGDEGKGRMVDYFAANTDCVIRYQGGDNAGHTVVNSRGRFALHNIPSGIFHPNVLNIIAAGSVLNPESFLREINGLKKMGISTDNVLISDRAILILPFHPLLDKLEDQRLKEKKYGSTLSGIAPVYGDKFMKKGIQVGELLTPEHLRHHLTDVLEYANLRLEKIYGEKPLSHEEIYQWLLNFAKIIKPYIANTQPIISEMVKNEQTILIEAQLGALRDITHGIYPYTTSSSTLASYACASIPVKPDLVKEIIGVTKAYSTCVGEGKFVTEMEDSLADQIRVKGKEFGAKTNRPRRIGFFDAIATKYGCFLQQSTKLAISCLDVLSGQKELKICVNYEIEKQLIDTFPIYPHLLKAKPVYETLPGWQEELTTIKNYQQLPLNARKYIERIEELCGVPVKFISVGPEREAMIVR